MSKIYVVEGHTGEYSDKREWPVAAYHTEEAAKAKVVRAEEVARLMFIARHIADNYWSSNDEIPAQFKTEDPKIQTYYNGTGYYYCSVELEDA